jgi:L-seryl-tRNA(Ser) seleniumtransferase
MEKNLLRKIPKVDKFLEDEELKKILNDKPRFFLLKATREVLEETRNEIKSGKLKSVDEKELKEKVKERLQVLLQPKLKKVINATGVIIHTNLGRAPIGEEVAQHLKEIITGYSNLEYDLEEGKRGLRYRNVEWILKELTGGEDVCVVNNNAGAVLLVLSALAKGKEVIVSRGELIEIGGSFRIPDVMAQSGAILKEVGTTNKTHLSDYENAISSNTALLMKVHTSNYRVLGFTASVSTKELSQLAKRHGIPLYEDLGSGCFIDTSRFGISHEPTVREVLEDGADIVSFSGDKLLGSAQAGIIVGKKELVEKIKKHPLNRALRIDKMTLAVLEATLIYYLEPTVALEKIPVWRMLSQSENEIRKRAKKLQRLLKKRSIETEIVRDVSEVGGGALPLETLPTYCVAFKNIDPKFLDKCLRKANPPVVGRIKEGTLLLDMRTVFDSEIGLIVGSVVQCFKSYCS